MAVASSSKEKNETSLDSSFPSSPLASKSGSDAGSDTSSVGNSAISEPSERSNDQFGSSPVHQRKDVEVQSPGYLRSEEYRLLFRLPSDEILVQDFNCAFQESILLQGHMYLFVRHICFYSNIFGFETKKVIPLNEITCVRKAKTAAIFPNAIEIASGAKKHFFASFLSRDEAYRVIVDRWCQHSNGASGLIDRQDSKSEIIIQDNELVTSERVQGSNSPSVHLSSDERDKDVHPEELYIISNSKDDVTAPAGIPEEEQNSEDSRLVANDEGLSSIQPLRWKLEDGDPPKVPECYTKVAESKFPIQAAEFFNLFFSDAATNFIEMFHKRCGDRDLSCSSWYDHEEIGYARDISFQHPIKIYFGAKFGHCQEVQKYRVYRNSHLVIETSQEVGDVPYADYFRVQGLWDVEEVGNETNRSCSLRVYVNVAFSKKTMWRGKIEQNTIDECRDAYALWLEDAHKLLKQNLEKLEGTTSASKAIENNESLSEESTLLVMPSERINDATTLPSFPALASESKEFSPRLENVGRGDLVDATSTAYLVRELFERICLYLKNRNHLPLVLVVAFIMVLLLMQLSIIVLLTRTPQVHVVSQMDYMNGIGSSKGDKAEAVAWLEKRIHHLKDEMLMVETRLEKMQREHMLLKSHIKGLEQLHN